MTLKRRPRLYEPLWTQIKVNNPNKVTIRVEPNTEQKILKAIRKEKTQDVASNVRYYKLKHKIEKSELGETLLVLWLEPYRVREQIGRNL